MFRCRQAKIKEILPARGFEIRLCDVVLQVIFDAFVGSNFALRAIRFHDVFTKKEKLGVSFFNRFCGIERL